MTQLPRFPAIMRGERKVLTFQVDDELSVGDTLVLPVDVEVLVRAGVDTAPGDIVVQSGLDASARNVLVVVEPQKSNVTYEFRVLCSSTDPTNKPGRSGLLCVM